MKYALISLIFLTTSHFLLGQVSLSNSWTSTLNLHTIGFGADRVLIYIIAIEDDDVTNDVTAVTYGGQSMNFAVESTIISGSLQRVEIWYLREAEINLASSSIFIPTFSISDPFIGGNNAYYTLAVTLKDVDQITTVCTAGTGYSTGSSTVVLNPSVPVLPSEIFIYGTSGGQNRTHTPATGYTEGIDILGATGSTSATANHKLITLVGSENPTSTSSSNHNRFVLAGVRIIPTGTLCSSALPFELVNFMAEATKGDVKLNWQTVSEINNAFFTIEHSLNGFDWENTTRVDGAGNSSSLLSYSIIDSKPYLGISYYRLKQTDFDGQFTYSYTISVNIKLTDNSQIEMYPNPANNKFTIFGCKNELDKINIYNTIGQDITLLTQQIENNETKVIIDLSKLSSGVYYIKTKTTGNKLYKQ
tara:strand:- start:7491 stop:8744 length:1254 start_codon:yes stop_codon:yes gene_type:complete